MVKKSSPPINDALWDAYLQSFFRFETRWDVSSYAVITAWNPYSKLRSKEENRISNRELEKRLKHAKYVPVTVGDSRFEWNEASFAAEISLELAISIAKEFHQNAIYYVEDGVLFLVACAEPGRKHRITEIIERLV